MTTLPATSFASHIRIRKFPIFLHVYAYTAYSFMNETANQECDIERSSHIRQWKGEGIMNAFEIVKIGKGLGKLGRNFQCVCLFQFISKLQCLLSLLVIVNVREILIKFSTKFSSGVCVCVCAFYVKREFFLSCCMQFIFVALRI
jgi:hypothetical protein